MSSATDRDRVLRDLEFLAEVTGETLSSLQEGTLLWRVVRLLRHRFGYDFAAVGLVDNECIVFRAGSGLELETHEPRREPPWRTPLGRGIVGHVAHQAQPHLCNDVSCDPNYVALSELPHTRSELAVPLLYHEQVIGVLDVQSARTNAFDDTDLHLLQIISALVAPAIHTARMLEWERRRARHLRLVNEISQLVMSSLNRDEVITVACEAILQALDLALVAIVLLDRTGSRILHGGHAVRGSLVEGVDIEHLSLVFGEGVVSEVIATGQVARIADVRENPRYKAVVRDVHSEMIVPLKVMGRTIGALVLSHTDVDHFARDEEALLGTLAGYLAQAIDNARLFDAQRRRWQQLLVINEVARLSTESIDLDQILALVANEVRDRFGYYAAAVLLCEDQDVVVHAVAAESDGADYLGYREPFGAGIAGSAVQHNQTIQVDDPAQFGGSRPIHPDVRSVLCVPLRNNDQVIGALQVQSLEAPAFDEDDRLVIETLAKSVAGAIGNARALRQTERLREDLNRMIVHDLRNPVQAMLLTLQEVATVGGPSLPGHVADSVNEGVQSAEEMLEMVNSLLDVARFEAGRAQLRLSPAVLNDHIRAVVRRFGPLARSKKIQVTTVLSADVPVLRFDHELVTRTLANLVGNALKFTPEGAPVTIRSELCTEGLPGVSRPRPPFVVVEVRDKGEGIPPEYHTKIFEKFGQVETRKAGLKMSTGLGLALCRYVVEAHGGSIWVDSQPGEGSSFYFTLPIPERPKPRE